MTELEKTRDDRRRVWQLSLAALLHDVGKLVQRAGAGEERKVIRPLLELYCPKSKTGRPTHWHAAYTAQFIEEHLSHLVPAGAGDQNLLGWASRHHAPATPQEWIVAEADRLSAGMDRGSGEESMEGDWRAVVGRRLEPVLARVRLTDGETPGTGSIRSRSDERSTINGDRERTHPTFRLTVLRTDADSLIPVEQPLTEIEDSRSAYQVLHVRLVEIARQLGGAGIDAVFQTLLGALESTCWAVPASTQDAVCDVSLYDHLRTSAALAACMARELPAESATEAKVKDRDRKRYLLACGSLHGLQAFIYTIRSKGAARSLRGRSFSVRLLEDAVATHLLHQLSLPPANLIFSGGGKFFLLLPASTAERVQELSEEVDYHLLDRYGDTIGFSLGMTALSGADLIEKRMDVRWCEALQQVQVARRRRMRGLVRSRYNQVFGPRPVEPAKGTCDACVRDILSVRSGVNEETCRNCAESRRLGSVLPRAGYLVRLYGDDHQSRSRELERSCDGAARITFAGQVSYVLLPNGEAVRATLDELQQACAPVVFSLGSTLPHPCGRAARGFWLTARNRATDEAGNIQTFDELAALSTGVDRLGVLRADMDNLGAIFQRGFPVGEATLSRLATLSRSLDMFFSGHLNRLVEGDDQLGRGVQIIYSGGDDLFLVGAWDQMPGLAYAIRQAIGRFAAGNPDVGLSAGIAMLPRSYPIRRGAEIAAEAERSAKAFARPGIGSRKKDAISILGRTLSWKELQLAAAVARDLAAWTHGGAEEPFRLFGLDATDARKAVPRGLLQRLLTIHALEQEQRERERRASGATLEELADVVQKGRWHWIAAYSLTRLSEKSPAKRFLTDLRDSLARKVYHGFSGGRPLIEYLDVPAKWAAVLTREARSRSTEVGE